MIKFSGVSDLQGVKFPVFPLTLLVIVTTVLRYRAACDEYSYLQQQKINSGKYQLTVTRSEATRSAAQRRAYCVNALLAFPSLDPYHRNVTTSLMY